MVAGLFLDKIRWSYNFINVHAKTNPFSRYIKKNVLIKYWILFNDINVKLGANLTSVCDRRKLSAYVFSCASAGVDDSMQITHYYLNLRFFRYVQFLFVAFCSPCNNLIFRDGETARVYTIQRICS